MSDNEFPTLPAEQLAERDDPKWEGRQSDQRVRDARLYALPLLVNVMAAQALGADVKDDDQFSDLVDQLYDGLRNRLTRQDLLKAFLDTLLPSAKAAADELLFETRVEVDNLIGSTQR